MYYTEYFEKWRYTDTINDYTSVIAEFQMALSVLDPKWNEKIKKGLGESSG
jgi:hypothetical protein